MSTSLIQSDLAVNWHPFMQMHDFETCPPKLIHRAEGIKLHADHEWYYDTISSWWCNLFGHTHPAIQAAVQQQLASLDHIMFGNFTHEPAIALSNTLVEQTPAGLDRVYYSDNGSTAIEVALKMSMQYWQLHGQQKTQYLCFEGTYHGDTVGAMSVSGVSQYNGAFQSMMFSPLVLGNPSKDEARVLEQLSQALKAHHHTIAAVVVEPLLMGAGGMQLTSPAFYQQVCHMANAHQVHVISDEVATGFGRSGEWFVSGLAKVSPHFMCLGKGLTNGQFPLAVTMTTADIYQAFYGPIDEGKTFYHGHTFTATPLGCAIANATMGLLKTEPWQDNVARIHAAFSQGFSQFQSQYAFVSNARSMGVMGACDVTLKGHRPMWRISQDGFRFGLTIRPLGNTIYAYVPLVTTPDEVSDILDRFDQLLQCAEQYR